MASTTENRDRLISVMTGCAKIKGIGQTGDINAPLIPGQSDIDLFVLCDGIPSTEERQNLYAPLSGEYSALQMSVCSGGLWGHGDILEYDGIPIMPMYFTISEMETYLDSVLKGEKLDRDGRFYPTGRLASVESIHILYETGEAWTRLVKKVQTHPEALFEKLYGYHIARVLDEEDLGRTLLRREVLFYHQVLESALDHLLQALFAENRQYFPSRKRTQNCISTFEHMPEHCWEQLTDVIRKAADPQTIPESIMILRNLTHELENLHRTRTGTN